MTPIARPTPATRPTLQGAFTALITPFTSDGAVDEDALRRLVRWQVLAGIDGLVPVGTTGEAPTLTPAERERVIAITVETVAERASRGRVPVVAGTGTNDTAATVAATRRAAELGADAARAGDWDGARRIHERWLPLFLANFVGGPNPVPVKAALELMGLLDVDAVRLPLLPLADDARAALGATLRTLGLVEAAGGRMRNLVEVSA